MTNQAKSKLFERKLLNHLVAWSKKPGRKPLILRGARQVGKTSTILLFGQKHFTQTIHINLEKPEHLRLFRQEISLKEFEQILQVAFGQKLIPGQTLLFIDEIQEVPHLLKLLRFFWEEKPKLHVIAAGSLFEVKLKETGFPLPVGRIEFAYQYPLDFFEYLKAMEQKDLLDFLTQVTFKETIPSGLHQQALAAFQQYALIGGMPEAVKQYRETQDLNRVGSLHSSLLTSLMDDTYKYSTLSDSQYLTFVIEQAPLFAGLPITYEKFAGSNYRSREMSSSFKTLAAALILYQAPATKSAYLPLIPSIKKPPKLLFLDAGLVNFVLGIQSTYLKPQDLASFYQGRIGEQIVGQQLLSFFEQQPPQLYYWYKKIGSEAEVDFCLSFKGKILGFEVKSGSTGKLKSVYEFAKTTQSETVFRIYSGPLLKEELKVDGKIFNLISLPFYLFPRWVDFVK